MEAMSPTGRCVQAGFAPSLRFKLGTDDACLRPFGLDHAWIDGVHADLPGPSSRANTPVMASTAPLVPV